MGEDEGHREKMGGETYMSLSTIYSKMGHQYATKNDHKMTAGHYFTDRVEISGVPLVVSGRQLAMAYQS